MLPKYSANATRLWNGITRCQKHAIKWERKLRMHFSVYSFFHSAVVIDIIKKSLLEQFSRYSERVLNWWNTAVCLKTRNMIPARLLYVLWIKQQQGTSLLQPDWSSLPWGPVSCPSRESHSKPFKRCNNSGISVIDAIKVATTPVKYSHPDNWHAERWDVRLRRLMYIMAEVPFPFLSLSLSFPFLGPSRSVCMPLVSWVVLGKPLLLPLFQFPSPWKQTLIFFAMCRWGFAAYQSDGYY